MKTLRVVILKPSKYGIHDRVERFRRGFMPNSTIPYLRGMTPTQLDGRIQTHKHSRCCVGCPDDADGRLD
jgi:hypothetical protein